jgi:hypothetical protein
MPVEKRREKEQKMILALQQQVKADLSRDNIQLAQNAVSFQKSNDKLYAHQYKTAIFLGMTLFIIFLFT